MGEGRGNERKRNASHPCLFYVRFISIDLGKGKCFFICFYSGGATGAKGADTIRWDGMRVRNLYIVPALSAYGSI